MACDQFSHYLLGSTFQIKTNHKPLVPLLSTKALDELPPRVLRFRLRLICYHFQIAHTPGKSLITADVPSRAPVFSVTPNNTALQSEVSTFVASVTDSLPSSDEHLKEIQSHQVSDEIRSTITTFCSQGWPDRCQLSPVLRPYWALLGGFPSIRRVYFFAVSDSQIIVDMNPTAATCRSLGYHQMSPTSQDICSVAWHFHPTH